MERPPLERELEAPFASFIRVRLVEEEKGRVRLALVADREHLDRWGRVHSGVLATMMDSTLGRALTTLRGGPEVRRRSPHPTIAMSVVFYDTARAGERLEAEGRVVALHADRAYGEAEVRCGDGRLLARADMVFAIVKER
jgi:uncharacterized protein (TIGR00369 family)